MRKPLAIGFAVIGLLGLSSVWAWPRPQRAEQDAAQAGHQDRPAPLDTKETTVRVLLGVGDAEPTPWDGKVSVGQGQVAGVEGWRFRAGDVVNGPEEWKAASLTIRTAARRAALKKAAQRGEGRAEQHAARAMTPNGVVVRLNAPDGDALTLDTAQGKATIPLADLASGSPRSALDGRVEARLVPPYAPIATNEFQEDFPAAAPDGKGGAWVAYVEHRPRGTEVSEALTEVPKSFKKRFVPEGGGDQIKLVHFKMEMGRGQVDRTIDVTEAGLDVWRPAVERDGEGRVVVVWSEQVEGNWDIYARYYDPENGTWSDRLRLTEQPGTDCHAVLTTYGDSVWMAWQSWVEGQADIYASSVRTPGATAKIVPYRISNTDEANEWSPAIAPGDGAIFVAYDTYEAGNYDVKLTSIGVANAPNLFKTVTVAGSTKYEARPSIAVDNRNRVWVAYEERTENWGKDFGNIPEAGTALYQGSAVRVRCIDGGTRLDAGDPVAAACRARGSEELHRDRRRAEPRRAGDELRPPDRARPYRAAPFAVPTPAGGHLGRQHGDGCRRRVGRVRDDARRHELDTAPSAAP